MAFPLDHHQGREVAGAPSRRGDPVPPPRGEAASPRSAGDAFARPSPRRSLRGAKILVADDDMRNMYALRAALLKKGCLVTVAKTGKEAIQRLAEDPQIDIILMDIMMPEMDGYEAISQIRADEKTQDLPIIALTAKAMKGDREKCLEVGASDYLSKPIDVDRLLSLMRVWLSG